MRLIIRASMALVALAAAALSYQSLAHLGELCGYGQLSWLYPLVVDLGAAASCAAWLHARSRQALGMTWSLLTVSVVLNGTTHFLESTATRPSWLLVVAVAAVPPTVLGLCVHLAVGIGRPADQDVPIAEPVSELAPVVPESAPAVSEPELADAVARLLAQGAGRGRIARELGISQHAARQLLAERTNGNGRH